MGLAVHGVRWLGYASGAWQAELQGPARVKKLGSGFFEQQMVPFHYHQRVLLEQVYLLYQLILILLKEMQ